MRDEAEVLELLVVIPAGVETLRTLEFIVFRYVWILGLA